MSARDMGQMGAAAVLALFAVVVILRTFPHLGAITDLVVGLACGHLSALLVIKATGPGGE